MGGFGACADCVTPLPPHFSILLFHVLFCLADSSNGVRLSVRLSVRMACRPGVTLRPPCRRCSTAKSSLPDQVSFSTNKCELLLLEAVAFLRSSVVKQFQFYTCTGGPEYSWGGGGVWGGGFLFRRPSQTCDGAARWTSCVTC